MVYPDFLGNSIITATQFLRIIFADNFYIFLKPGKKVGVVYHEPNH